jgi:hypothetical protein
MMSEKPMLLVRSSPECNRCDTSDTESLSELTAGPAHDTSTGIRAVLRATMFSAR